MYQLRRLPMVLALITLISLAPLRTASADPVPVPRPSRHVLGPGRTTEPGFVGYVTAGGAALGIARLPDGRYGICLDTGRREWPRKTADDGVHRADPRAGYLTSRYLPIARRDPVTATALWWAVGLDLGLNSGRSRMRGHLEVAAQEAPRLFRRIRLRHRALMNDLRAHVSPSGRYLVGRPALGARRITGLGVRSESGPAMTDALVTLRLQGGVFTDGRHLWHGRVPAGAERGPRWRRLSGGRVRLTVRYAGIPAAGYVLVRSGRHFQRVAVAAATTGRVRTAELPALPRPNLRTSVSSARTVVGSRVSDAVTITGAEGAALTGHWRLLGPLLPGPSGCDDLEWASAATAGSGRFEAAGDGTYHVGAMTIPSTGCYTYVERLDASPTTRATSWTGAGTIAETTLGIARPALTTSVSRQRATVEEIVHDVVSISGLPAGSTVELRWRLLGPVAPRGSTCRGATWLAAPVRAEGLRAVDRDGRVVVGSRSIRRGGCYSYQERLEASPLTLATAWTTPGIAAESTAVAPRTPRIPAHPQVDTGGSRPAVRGRRATAPVTTTVRIPGTAHATPLAPMGFRASTLTPPALGVGGWWSGGAHLDALVGTTIVAGHVADDHGHLGPFARLRRAGVGTIIRTTSAGVTTRWRVTHIRSYDRRRLPRRLFGQHLARRLVLITCTDKVTRPDGAFHYRRNLVVSAVPAKA